MCVRRWRWNRCTQFSVPRFIFAMYVAMIGLRYFLSFMQNTLWREHDLSRFLVPTPTLVPPFRLTSVFSFFGKNCIMLLIDSCMLRLVLSPQLKCKTCTNLNLFCGQIVWFRSFRGRESQEKTQHHTDFLSVYSLGYISTSFFRCPRRRCLYPPRSMDCTDIYHIFLMLRISFHYE